MNAPSTQPGNSRSDANPTPFPDLYAHPLASPLPLDRGLGQREREVMAILWEHGSSNVQKVLDHLDVSLAYTTVMTTLDRLFKKGLLQREKIERAFVYSTTLSAREIEDRRAANLVRRFFSDTGERPDLLVSCLVDAMQMYDTRLLDTMETKIRLARTQHLASGVGNAAGNS